MVIGWFFWEVSIQPGTGVVRNDMCGVTGGWCCVEGSPTFLKDGG